MLPAVATTFGAHLTLKPLVKSRVRAAQMISDYEMLAARIPEIDAFNVHQTQELLHRPRHIASAFVAGTTALSDADGGPVEFDAEC